MKVNTKVRYGLRAILQIADAYGGEPVPVSAISRDPGDQRQVPGAGRRRPAPGRPAGQPQGCARAATPWPARPRTSPCGRSSRALDNHTALVDCVLEPEICDRAGDCLTRSIWTLLSRRMEEFWTSFTLADLLVTLREAGDTRLQQLAQFERSD